MSKIEKLEKLIIMAHGFKSGGRKKGSSNKLSGTIKEMISEVVTRELQEMPILLNQMTPREKIDFILKLLPYITPKIAPIEETQTKNPNKSLSELFEMQMQQRNLDNNALGIQKFK